jgi:hypothetical protein
VHVVTTIHTRLPLDPADIRLGVSVGTVPALPAGPPRREDPPAPERILRSLPEREREAFLAEYRLAVDGARDPAGWPELLRFLRLWSFRAIAVNQPGYYEAWEQVSAGGGMLLEDAIKLYRPGT